MKEKIKQTLESLLAGLLIICTFFTDDYKIIILLSILYALVMLKKTEAEDHHE